MTAKRDRSEKLLAYMQIPTLSAHLLVEQDKAEVEFFYKNSDRGWWVDTVSGLDSVIELACPLITLGLAEIYAGVVFS